MSELLGGQSELIKRVDELRSLYRSHREELGVRSVLVRSFRCVLTYAGRILSAEISWCIWSYT